MALIDIHNELLRATAVQLSAAGGARRQVDLPTYADETTEKQLTVAVLKALLDPIGEVKNMAVSWYVELEARDELSEGGLMWQRGSHDPPRSPSLRQAHSGRARRWSHVL